MNDQELFMAIRKIADMAFEYASRNPVSRKQFWLDDRRSEEVNPFYDQTSQGVFLEQYYGIPGKLWTPWGYWNCWGSGSPWDDNTMNQFLNRLGAVLYIPMQLSHWGQYGPVYALHKVDSLPLPEPIIRTRTEFLPYEEAKEIWKRLDSQYQPVGRY